MKSLLFRAAILGMFAVSFTACSSDGSDLLDPKLYFEQSEITIDIDKEDSYTVDLVSRLSKTTDSNVAVTYTIGDESMVDEYNARTGKSYKALTSAVLDDGEIIVSAGQVVSNSTALHLSGLSGIEMGDKYLLPVCLHTSDVPVISGQDVVYVIVNKPVKKTRAANFRNNFFKVPISPLNKFSEITYEALVCVSQFYDNNTVMGCEGVLIMRIGDAGGGTVPKDILQVAGKTEMTWTNNPLSTNTWYHLALTVAADGTANLYVNGEVKVSGNLDAVPEDLTAGGADFGFSVGQVPRFKWGTRPFYGYMSEVRLWNVARTANQIKENMLNVSPNSEGLVAYYRLEDNLDDSTVNGFTPTDFNSPAFVDLSKPITVGGTLN